MSLLFDRNSSGQLPALLAHEFPGPEQVSLVGLADASDVAAWNDPAVRGLAVVFKDADFELLAASLGPPPKVIALRPGNCPARDRDIES